MSANPSSSHPGGGGSSTGGGSGSAGGVGGPCGACKFLRRKCVVGCIFAPYFDSEHGATHFAAVHKVFGASNVSKLLLNIPVNKRLDAVVTVCFEAQARIRDPVYGCVAHLFSLQQQVMNLQAEISYLKAHLATLEPPLLLPPQPPAQSTGFSIGNSPITSCFPANYDLSALFDPMMQSSAWSMQPLEQQVNDPIQFSGGGGDGGEGEGGSTGDLHELARELLQRQGTCRSSEDSTLPQHKS